jgi:hypothetical protein
MVGVILAYVVAIVALCLGGRMMGRKKILRRVIPSEPQKEESNGQDE